MAEKFKIEISATDRATARIRAIKASIASLVSPITNVGKSVRTIGKEVGVDKIGQDFQGLSKLAAGAIKNISGVGGALAGAVGVGSVSAIAMYAKQWLIAGSATQRAAATLGMLPEKLQNLQGAATLGGLKPEDMTQSLEALGNTMQDAKWGRNQGALLMMNRLKIPMRLTKDGAIDTAASLGDLADVISKMKAPVQTKAMVAREFGVEALLPMLLKGRKAMEDLEAAAEKVRPPLSAADVAVADQYRQKIDSLGLSFDNLGNSIMKVSLPTAGSLADYIAKNNKANAEDVRKRGFWGHMAHSMDESMAISDSIAEIKGWAHPKRADPKTEKESIDDFKRMGWSDAAAKGLTANMIDESNIDPHAVGDGGAARGALQWHKDRQENYRRWAATQAGAGKDIGHASLADQRKFMDYELRKGAEQAAGRRLAAAPDARQAAMVASMYYVRPAETVHAAVNRGRTADDLDKAFPAGGIQPVPTAPQLPPGAGSGQVAANQGAGKGQNGSQRGSGGATAAPDAAAAPGGPAQPAAAAPGGPGRSLIETWQASHPAPTVQPSALEVKITIPGAPPGTKAEVVGTSGPVQTALKTEFSMPDYSL